MPFIERVRRSGEAERTAAVSPQKFIAPALNWTRLAWNLQVLLHRSPLDTSMAPTAPLARARPSNNWGHTPGALPLAAPSEVGHWTIRLQRRGLRVGRRGPPSPKSDRHRQMSFKNRIEGTMDLSKATCRLDPRQGSGCWIWLPAFRAEQRQWTMPTADRLAELFPLEPRLATGPQRVQPSGSRVHRSRRQQEGRRYPRLSAAGRQLPALGDRPLPAEPQLLNVVVAGKQRRRSG